MERIGDSPNASYRVESVHPLQLQDDNRPVLRICILGPMTISLGGRSLELAELRRGRVRSVLTLLAVRGPMRRDQLIELLWPDSELRLGRQNLRATLSRLRRLLHPGDEGERCHFRLRANRDLVSLADPPAIEVDLWELRRLIDEADDRAAGAEGELEPIEPLRQAVALVRGTPVPDLEAVVGVEADVEQIRVEVVETCHRLGELLLAAGHWEEALRCADRTRHDAPYSERAHRLAISALLQIGDRGRIERRIAALFDMLVDFGVDPEPTTSMLLARVSRGARSGRAGRGLRPDCSCGASGAREGRMMVDPWDEQVRQPSLSPR